MSKEIDRLRNSSTVIRQMGSVLSWIFSGLFVLLCIVALFVCLSVVPNIREFDSSGTLHLEDGGELIPMAAIFVFLISAASLLLLRRMSKDVAIGLPLFSNTHARGIAFLGVLFLFNAILPVLTPTGQVSIDLRVVTLFFSPNPLSLIIGDGVIVDLGSILSATFCFSFALFWRYGTLLQCQSDDLV